MWDELYVRLRAFSASAFALRATPDKPAGQEEIRLRVDVRLRRPSVNRSVGRTRRWECRFGSESPLPSRSSCSSRCRFTPSGLVIQLPGRRGRKAGGW